MHAYNSLFCLPVLYSSSIPLVVDRLTLFNTWAWSTHVRTVRVRAIIALPVEKDPRANARLERVP